MDGAPDKRNDSPARRGDVRWTYVNALVWALGNGLVSRTLVIYLALELGAQSVAIAWIVAAPRFAGVLRLGVPGLMVAAHRVGLGRKAVCLIGYTLSGLVLTLVPLAAWGVTQSTPAGAFGLRIGVLTFAWCLYHLLEYVATVALWSWIGDLYPRRLRSRLIGVRERWLTVGRAVGVGVSIALAVAWGWWTAGVDTRVPLAVSATIGAALMLLAVLPLAAMTPRAAAPSATPENPWRTLRRAVAERPYRRLLAYSSWLGLANGVSGAAQGMYPQEIGVGYARMQGYLTGMWAGQSALAPWCGRMVARHGARRVMLPAQLLVALGPLAFWMATPEAPGWIGVAYLVWVAYAAINVGLDTLKLNLADPRNNAPYLAVYHAASDLVNALTVLAGGLLYDTLREGDAVAMNVYTGLFLAGWAGRTAAAGLVARLIEPHAAQRATMGA